MRFRALDGFRGLCALLVALYHLPIYNHFLGPQFFLPNAQMLMDFFFVLSGFLIAGAYGEKLASWGNVGEFARSRFARLWPLHAVMLILFVAIETTKAVLAPGLGAQPPFSGAKPLAAILSNLFLVHSLHLHPMLTWNAPSWTVSVEFWTYLLFAALTVLWPRRPILIGAAMAAVGAAGVILIARKLDASYDWGLFRCFYGFFCGVLLSKVVKAAPLRLPNQKRLATAIELAAIIGVFAYIALLGGAPFGYAGPLVFSLFMWIYAAEQGAVTGWLSCGPLVRLGEISYSIYLVHFPLIVVTALSLRLVEHLLHVDFAAFGFTGLDQMSFVRGPSKLMMDGVMVGYLILVVAAADWAFKYIEGPGRKLLTAPRRAPAPALTAQAA